MYGFVPVVGIGLALIASLVYLRLRNWDIQHRIIGYQPRDLATEVRFMDGLSGYDFEDYVAWLLARNGFTQIRQTAKDDDAGLDILAVRNHQVFGFQCKHYRKRSINRRTVKHTADAGHYYGTSRVVIITNSRFSPYAKSDQKFFHVDFWDRTKLIQLIQNAIR